MVNAIRADVAGDTQVDFFLPIDAALYQGIVDRFVLPPIMDVPEATRRELAAYWEGQRVEGRERRNQEEEDEIQEDWEMEEDEDEDPISSDY